MKKGNEKWLGYKGAGKNCAYGLKVWGIGPAGKPAASKGKAAVYLCDAAVFCSKWL